MSDYFLQNLDEALFLKTKRILEMGIDSHFRWGKPYISKGKFAINTGKFSLDFGIFLLTTGILAIVGIFY